VRSTDASPLVGRDAALAAIRAAIDAPGTLVTVWGAPGLGKSRLADAIAARLREDDRDVVVLRAPTIADAARWFPGDDDDGAIDAVSGGAIAGTAAERFAAAPGALRQAATRALAARIAVRNGVVIVDDADEADPVVLDAIELATANRAIAIAFARPVLATMRPRWARRAVAALKIELAPLDREQGRALIAALAPSLAAAPVAVLDLLAERCGGIPLHVTELVAALQVDALLVREVPTRDIVAWSIGERLARFPRAVAIAEIAAMIARDVAIADIHRIVEVLDPDRAPGAGAAIGELIACGLFVDRGRDAVGFCHATVRDAIAGRVDPDRRVAIHRAILEGSVARTIAEAALHLDGAGEIEGAVDAWRHLARAALERHDDLGADAAATRVLDSIDAPDGEMLRLRGNARMRLGRNDTAAADFGAARALAERRGERGAVIDLSLDEAAALDQLAQHAAAAALVDRATAAACRTEPALRLARLAMAAGRTAWRAGDGQRAIAPLRDAILLADAIGGAGYETAIGCRLMIGTILCARGAIDDAAVVLDQAYAAALSRGDVVHLSAVRLDRYPVHAARGDLAAARADFAAIADAGREIGIAAWEYRGAIGQALIGLWTGDDTAAFTHALIARRIEIAEPALFPRPRAALVLGELAARAGDRGAVARWRDVIRVRVAAAPIAIDRVVVAALDAWLERRLDLDRATELARDAVAAGENEVAFQVLELVARTAARDGDPALASTAARAARSVPPVLPRFIA
jgi:hypothetical protein